MDIKFCSLASSSSGNCYLLQSNTSAILIDAGISTRKIHNAIDDLKIDRDSIKGVFITHEHSDHIKGIKTLTKKNPDWRVFASEGTSDCIKDKIFDPDMQLISFQANDTIFLDDFEIKSFSISHDAVDPVAYSIKSRKAKVTILTDTGFVSDQALAEMSDSDVIVLEANHEVNVLKAGQYPYSLKCRILGECGHLSNETAGQVLLDIMKCDKCYHHIFLAHLSNHNNFPDLAKQTVSNILEEEKFYIGKHLHLDVIARDGLSSIIEI